jgi:hypothetical protein
VRPVLRQGERRLIKFAPPTTAMGGCASPVDDYRPEGASSPQVTLLAMGMEQVLTFDTFSSPRAGLGHSGEALRRARRRRSRPRVMRFGDTPPCAALPDAGTGEVAVPTFAREHNARWAPATSSAVEHHTGDAGTAMAGGARPRARLRGAGAAMLGASAGSHVVFPEDAYCGREFLPQWG